tara:strand:+ start:1417 stop:2325 length:909 start_codon:yes stop_codon:yes gene_type:complete
MQRYFCIALFVSLFLLSPFVQANPVACFKTNMGTFCIELFVNQNPVTVTNFFDYINNSAYTDGIFHRSVPGFVLQAGGFKIINNDDGISLAAVNTLEPIANEFGMPNMRGTVAMAKLAGEPDSATSQWFVNLSDNAANLDNQNGGFTVFGKIIYDGMTVIDAIADLPLNNFSGELTSTPTKDFNGQNILVENLIRIISIEVTNPVGIFNKDLLSFAVNVGNNEFFAVSLRLIATNPKIIFELDSASITPLQTSPDNVAVFSMQDGTLNIPSVMLDDSTTVNNVLMTLTDANTFQFTLLSMEQ